MVGAGAGAGSAKGAAELAAAAAATLGALGTSHEQRLQIASARGVAVLLRCLVDGTDRSVQEPACAALRALCLSGTACAQVAGSADLDSIVGLLTRGDAQLREAAAGLLGTVALHPQGRSRALATSAVPALVKLLPLRHEPTQEAAARAIRNLALDPDGLAQVTKAGGMQPLVRLLQSRSEGLHGAAAAALEVTSVGSQPRAHRTEKSSWALRTRDECCAPSGASGEACGEKAWMKRSEVRTA
mmetsp:Transcript_1982/g.5962  ORF Transcript_1982/g.5962 Transcript_1982/m.5962 type:complete len:243 (-) Transcript_1982:497-1225(-)